MSAIIPPEELKAIVVRERLIAPDRFDALRAEAKLKNQDLLDILISEGPIERAYLVGLIARTLGVELAKLDTHSLDKKFLSLLPEKIARQYQAIVFGEDKSGTLQVAMMNPSDLAAVKFLSNYLNRRIRVYLATDSDLQRGFSVYGSESAKDFKKIIEENVQASLKESGKSAEEAASELPIVAIVDNLLSYAIASRASDVHIEELEDAVLVRYRIDGILTEVMRIPKEIHSAIVARFKVLAGLKLDEHYRPQDGRFRYQIVGKTIDVRVGIMATYYGEKVEMRLLDSGQRPLSLEEVGMLPPMVEIVRRNLSKSYGMILACGPTGSGKSTTLYAMINIVNKPTVNIVTVEDPIEYNMRYVNQSQINPLSGVTFASGLREILRQDPNIIMVGEIRDSETADISVQAALTGHLLISSLHTNDAPTTIPRLFDLGVPPFLVTSVLNVVIAQRLVRRVCPVCIYSYEPEADIKSIILSELRELHVSENAARMPPVLYRGKGCSTCGATGYRGRLGIYELLEVNEEVRKAIVDPAFSLEKLQEAARANGMRSMFEDGIEKAELGLTTIEEVLRVIRE